MSRKSGGTVSSNLNNINYNQQQNTFDVQYIGQSSFPNNSTGNGPLQIALLDIYTKFNTSKGFKKLPRSSLVLTKDGLQVVKADGSVFYGMSSISECKAVTFIGSKTKMNGTKTYGYVFDYIRHQQQPSQQQFQNWILRKDQKYLLKSKHVPLVACILRRETGIKTLDVHAFACLSNDQALSISYSIEMALRVYADAVKQDSQLFKYDPFDPRNDTTSSDGGIGGGAAKRVNSNNISNKDNNMLKPRNALVRQTFSPSSTKDAELPEVIQILGALGAGKGSVVNPVIKTTNINLINSDFFNGPSKKTDNENRVFLMNQNDISKPHQQQHHQQQQQQFMQAKQRQHQQQKPSRSASMHFLNEVSAFTDEITFEDLIKDQRQMPNYYNLNNNSDKGRKPQVKPIQLSRSRSFKDESSILAAEQPRKASTPDNDNRRITVFGDSSQGSSNNSSCSNLSANPAVNLNPLGDKPNRPIAMVQPRKIQGIKVFPAGNDRTLLIPEKTKFLKKSKPDEISPSQSQKQNVTKRDSMGLYAAVSKVNRENNVKTSNVNNNNNITNNNNSKIGSSNNLHAITNSSNNLNRATPNLNRKDTKGVKDQFVIKSSSENQLKKQVVGSDIYAGVGGGGGAESVNSIFWPQPVDPNPQPSQVHPSYDTSFQRCMGFFP